VSFRENHWPGLADHRTVAALLWAATPATYYLHHSVGRHSAVTWEKAGPHSA